MIIEFFGLPGSGKTTLAENIKEKYCLHINKTYTDIQLICQFNILHILISLVTLLRYVKKISKNKLNQQYLVNFIHLFFVYNQLDKKDEIYVFDHGLIQSLITIIWDNNNDIKTIEELFNKFSMISNKLFKNIKYIWTNHYDLNQIYKRIMFRTKDIRIKDMDEKNAYRILSNQQIMFAYAAKRINAEEIDTSCSIDKNIDDIKKSIM